MMKITPKENRKPVFSGKVYGTGDVLYCDPDMYKTQFIRDWDILEEVVEAQTREVTDEIVQKDSSVEEIEIKPKSSAKSKVIKKK